MTQDDSLMTCMTLSYTRVYTRGTPAKMVGRSVAMSSVSFLMSPWK